MTVVNYLPAGPVVKSFHKSNAFVRGLMGPIGSGKSTACTIELLRRAQLQEPAPDGIRYSRWAIIRNSFPELRSTTLKTWEAWAPITMGKFVSDSPIVHHFKTGEIDAEFLFMAMDKPEDARKLLGIELTGAWVNEAREIQKGVIDMLSGRIGRYPSGPKGGCTWSGIIMDTNPPDTESWWYRYAEIDTPDGWEFFRQPSGLSEDAENLNWLLQTAKTRTLPLNDPERLAKGRMYYERYSAGKDPDAVKVYVHGEYGLVTEGQPVYPNYRDATHCSPIEPMEDVPIMIGADFGLTPAAVIAQHAPDGRWFLIDEFVTEDVGVIRFAEQLKSYISTKYPDYPVSGWGDPAGNQRAFSDERTALEIMQSITGWSWRPAPGNNELGIRIEVVRAALNRMVDGNPGVVVSPNCPVLRKGFAGGYCRKFIKTGDGQLHEQPSKNKYSHPHDALQYVFLGGGEHQVILSKRRKKSRYDSRTGRFFDIDTGLEVINEDRSIAKNVDYPMFGR